MAIQTECKENYARYCVRDVHITWRVVAALLPSYATVPLLPILSHFPLRSNFHSPDPSFHSLFATVLVENIFLLFRYGRITVSMLRIMRCTPWAQHYIIFACLAMCLNRLSSLEMCGAVPLPGCCIPNQFEF